MLEHPGHPEQFAQTSGQPPNEASTGVASIEAQSAQTPGIVPTAVQTTMTPYLRQFLKEAGLICLREFFGTAILTYMACMQSMTAGLIYTALQASSEISCSGGLHLNPVISLAVAVAGKMRAPILIIPVIVCQFLGALLGAGFCLASQTKEQFLDRSGYHKIYTVEKSQDLHRYCFGEFLLTSILVTVFLSLFPLRTPSVPVTKEEIRDYQKWKYIHAISVGLTITALTGAMYSTKFIGAMNPFRVFGPMAVWVSEKASISESDTGHLWKGHWVYWVGPIGAGIAVGIIEGIIEIFKRNKTGENNGSFLQQVLQGLGGLWTSIPNQETNIRDN